MSLCCHLFATARRRVELAVPWQRGRRRRARNKMENEDGPSKVHFQERSDFGSSACSGSVTGDSVGVLIAQISLL